MESTRRGPTPQSKMSGRFPAYLLSGIETSMTRTRHVKFVSVLASSVADRFVLART